MNELQLQNPTKETLQNINNQRVLIALAFISITGEKETRIVDPKTLVAVLQTLLMDSSFSLASRAFIISFLNLYFYLFLSLFFSLFITFISIFNLLTFQFSYTIFWHSKK